MDALRIDPPANCKDGKGEGSQIVERRNPWSDLAAWKENHCCVGDRQTVGRNLVCEPQGQDERTARCYHQLDDELGVDVDVGGQPAGQLSRTKPQGKDEMGAMAGTKTKAI